MSDLSIFTFGIAVGLLPLVWLELFRAWGFV